ncbi:MAG: NUDIX domain-containing protein [Acetobacteraceae bacterium]|nr:NUDIX domain-containing protein [Acetobacteraceae bacterium]
MTEDAIPRPAATVLLLRDGPTGMEVFMVVRHDAIAFAGGALVFPGGRVDDADHEFTATNPFHVAAIRETFEECGVLLARPNASRDLVQAERAITIEAKWRTLLCAAETDFATMLVAEKLSLAADLLVPFAHWITPRTQRKRFDTHFFMAQAPSDQLAAHDGSESVDSMWITPEEVFAGQARGDYKLVFPTFLNLKKLARFPTAAAALAATRASHVVTVMPEQVKLDDSGRRHLRLPIEAGYGGELFEVDLPSSS